MMRSVDVAIIGGGFGGSLLSLILHRAGLSVLLIDRGKHPRFAIGESSTPIANLVLSDLCREYDLSNVAPLAKYGSWQAAHPELIAGIKRGFSYFAHQDHQPFAADAVHSTELLVAASSRDESADTHWLRQDVDAFLFREAAAAGVVVRDAAEVTELFECGEAIELQLSSDERWQVRFVVDASGDAGWLPKRLGIEDRSRKCQTNSRAVFAHFSGVQRWQHVMRQAGFTTDEHPFDCDHAALHHVFANGWMWQLRFNDESVSAGFVLHDDRRQNLTAGSVWDECLARFPSIVAQFGNAKVIRPESGLRLTGRLQRKWARAAGPWWALLPNTAGFIDPLHSTGLAHTLCGIERLGRILIRSLGRSEFTQQLRQYESCVLAELTLIDQLVSGCFLALGEFRLFVMMSMLYFAAATSYERSRLESPKEFHPAFLLADNELWKSTVAELRSLARRLISTSQTARNEQLDSFESNLITQLTPFNRVGLCDGTQRNMYRHSALPESSSHAR